MSGPGTPSNEDAIECHDDPESFIFDVMIPRRAMVGGFDIARVLPQRQRRMIGPWCFVDVMGPVHVTQIHGMNVGPHPHIGLQTVTWLVEGALLHRDSLGSEQLIHPGQLNLMTAGHGVSHSEETTGFYDGPMFGIQMWIAQPENTRHAAPEFAHYENLPQLQIDSADITVFLGEFNEYVSPARRDTNHLGMEIFLHRGTTTIPLQKSFEYGALVLNDSVHMDGQKVEAEQMAYLGTQRDHITLSSENDVRLLLLGGEEFEEDIVMWWNYVARTRAEISTAHTEWSTMSSRFGKVNTTVPRIDVKAPPW